MEEILRYEILWHVLIELLINATISRTHVISVVDLVKVLFQVQTPSKADVQGEVKETIDIDDGSCGCGK